MKKLLVISILLAFALISYGQVTNVPDVRTPTRASVLGKNLPVGSHIYVSSDSTNWDVKSATLGTYTVTTALAAGLIKQSDRTDLSLATRTSTTNIIRSNYGDGNQGDSVILAVATTSLAGLESAADKTKLDGLSTGAGQLYSESLEYPDDSTAGSIITMDYSPKDTLCIVLECNGQILTRSVDYFCADAIAKKELLIKDAVSKYDKYHYSISK
jgi:hypothetical protein